MGLWRHLQAFRQMFCEQFWNNKICNVKNNLTYVQRSTKVTVSGAKVAVHN